MAKITQERDDLRLADQEGVLREGLGGLWRKEVIDSCPLALTYLSPHSVCKKSPNLFATLLPPLDLSLKQCQRWVQPCAGKGGFPREIRPKKE